MKLETVIYSKMKGMLPENTSKTVFYANISDNTYEMMFYSFFRDGKIKQCYELAEMNVLNGYQLEKIFDDLAKMIRADEKYKAEMQNVFTLVIDSEGVQMQVEYYDKKESAYRIKKGWKEKYLQ